MNQVLIKSPMANTQSFLPFLTLLCYYLYMLFHTIHATNPQQNGFSLKMVYRNSPDAPSYQPNLTHNEIVDDLFRTSEARVKTLEQLVISSNQNAIPPVLGLMHHGGLFLVQVGIGTFLTRPPFKEYYLGLEITSAHTWTQCKGCSPCFPQKGPPFPWDESHTYHSRPCTHCPGACRSNFCQFNITFPGDDIYIRGNGARDKFTFQSDNAATWEVDFICVISSGGFFGNTTEDNVASGVLALGREGYTSLMNHVKDPRIADGRFSYCLQPLNLEASSPMYLRFGDDIPIRVTRPNHRTYTTDILRSPNFATSSLYYLELFDLSVGGRRLGLDHRVFSIKSNGSGGCVIDAGTAMSYLPRSAYDRLEESMSQKIEDQYYGIDRVDSPFPAFTTCYERNRRATGWYEDFPAIKFHFDNSAALEVRKPMGEYMSGHRQLHCLQIRPSDAGICVIGAIQQVNHRFVFDIRNSELRFGKHNCSETN